MMFRIVIVAALVAGCLPVFAQAADKATPGIGKRQERQTHRIHQGVRSGHLTKTEARELREGQREIRQMKRDAKADGVVTAEEREALQQKLNEESREICLQKHDGQNRGQRKKMPDVKAQQKLQHRSIQEGVQSGQLTPEEAKALRDGQKEVRDLVKAVRADGIVTEEEKASLTLKLEQENQRIIQEKTDAELRTADADAEKLSKTDAVTEAGE